MNDAEKKTEDISYSGFGIDVIPEQKAGEKKDENIPFLKKELSSKQYGIEILEKAENDTDSPEGDFSSSKNKVEISDSGPNEEDVYK